MEFKLGDVVQLKSGGPEMTVQNIVGKTTNKTEMFAYTASGHAEGAVVCKWFSGNELKSDIFKPETLNIVES